MCTFVKYLRYVFVVMALATTCGTAVSQSLQRQWQTVSTVAETAEDKIDIVTREGYIYLTTSKQITVKVYTILGQLVVSQTLPPGVSRLQLRAHGIYILKAGELTRRITV